MEVTVIGTGYVGLVTAVSFAELGHQVVGVDENLDKVKRLAQGETVIFEPGVDGMLTRNLEAGRLRFTGDIADGVQSGRILFICVGTPPREDGSANLSQVERVTRIIAEHMTGYRLLVEKSTVPVQTAQWIERTLRLYGSGDIDFDVASNPEFTREGSAVQDFLHPDRIVIGVSSQRAADLLEELYRDFDCPKVVTDVSTAELIKHASNSFLATKISFINMVADVCEAAGADVETVAEGMGLDRRIGRAFLNAGLGYGGSCFPKDLSAFVHLGQQLGVSMHLLQAVEDINRRRVDLIQRKLQQALWVTEGKTIAMWGLAFKPHTDDVRGSPALALADSLTERGASVRAYDPQARETAAAQLPAGESMVYAESALDAARGADALVVATEWPEFCDADLAAVRQVMATPILIDARNALDADRAVAAGFEYIPVGKAPRSSLA